MNPPICPDTLGLILGQHPLLQDASRLDQSPAVGELVVMLTSGVELADSDVIVFPDADGHLHAVRCDDTGHFEVPDVDHGDPADVGAAINEVFAVLGG